MILVMDVGNTNIVVGVFKENDLVATWHLSTNPMLSKDEHGLNLLTLFGIKGIDEKEIKSAIISSVVPTMTHTLSSMIKVYFNIEPLVIGPGIKTGINIKYDNPKEVGSDRIVNAAAAYKTYGGPCIIVDFGTATTFDVVNENGEYIGGALCPGLKISSEALFSKTSKLPKVDLVKPKNVIGRNTEQSMQSGIINGYIGEVRYIIDKMKEEVGENAKVVATGDYSKLICKEIPTVDYINDDLTFLGLKILYELNKNKIM